MEYFVYNRFYRFHTLRSYFYLMFDYSYFSTCSVMILSNFDYIMAQSICTIHFPLFIFKLIIKLHLTGLKSLSTPTKFNYKLTTYISFFFSIITQNLPFSLFHLHLFNFPTLSHYPNTPILLSYSHI